MKRKPLSGHGRPRSRNPLHTILGFSDFLLEISSDPEQQKFLQIIRDVSQFMAHLVDDLLDNASVIFVKLAAIHQLHEVTSRKFFT